MKKGRPVDKSGQGGQIDMIIDGQSGPGRGDEFGLRPFKVRPLGSGLFQREQGGVGLAGSMPLPAFLMLGLQRGHIGLAFVRVE